MPNCFIVVAFEAGATLETDTQRAAIPPSRAAAASQGTAASQHRKATHLNYEGSRRELPIPAAVAPLLPLLLNLSGDDCNLMLKVLTHPDFSAQDIPFKSAEQVYAFLDSRSTPKT